jgi:hypothetical protein
MTDSHGRNNPIKTTINLIKKPHEDEKLETEKKKLDTQRQNQKDEI